MRLGYALPTGQASGVEVERVLALQSAEKSGPYYAYMQLSRARECGILIVTEDKSLKQENCMTWRADEWTPVPTPPPRRDPPVPQPAQYQTIGISR
jgi:hypothetical protein